ncbi:MAG: HEAT repeat domain-containing protein [Verrucomicrobia bacterium]|nr:HEAT repeat domain-containing protein [Verrucomicrobiota bacterium]
MKRVLSALCLAALALSATAADFDAAVADLIPQLANPDVPKRYDAQMALQDLASAASQPGNDADRAALSALLAAKAADPNTPQPARVWIVRQLEYIGRDEAVKALDELLHGNDPELRECARRALEKNPARAAIDSLRRALEKGGDEARKIGLIHALGERRDPAAVPLLAQELDDTKTGWAAAMALGRIANDEAVAALWSALAGNPFADSALIQAADRKLAAGETAAALAIYTKLDDPNQPVAIRAAALSGLIHAAPSQAPARVQEGLASNDPRLQQAVIAAAHRALGRDASRLLAEALPKLAAPAKLQILPTLDASAESAVVTEMNAKDGDDSVRLAALETLGRIGTGTAVPALLAAAANAPKPVSTTAAAALARISGPGAVRAILAAAAEGSPETRAAAITALAARRDESARPALARYAADSDSTVRNAALAALGKLGGDDAIEQLAKAALAKKDPTALAALEAAAARVADKPAAVRQLLALAGSDDAAIRSLLNTFAVLGGTESLPAISRLAANTDPKTREAAVRTLSNWPDYPAVEPLLALVKNPDIQGANYMLALAGAVRLIKTADTQPLAQRAQDAVSTLDATRGDAEKRLSLSLLGTIPHPLAAAAIKPWLAQPTFKAEATQAGLGILKALAQSDPASAKELADALKAASPNSASQVDQALR